MVLNDSLTGLRNIIVSTNDQARRTAAAKRVAEQNARKRRRQSQRNAQIRNERAEERRKQVAAAKPTNENIRKKAIEWANNFDASQYDNTCYIVAGGPSLINFNWEILTPDKYVVAINRSYEKLPNAQLLYYTDNDYEQRHIAAMRGHTGQMMRGVLNPSREKPKDDVILWHLTGPTGYSKVPGTMKHGSNSTHAAINMCAAHLGFKKIYVLGLDMRWGRKGDRGTSHWHDGHKRIDPEGSYRKMMRSYVQLAQRMEVESPDVKVYNANPDSALTVFPRVTLQQVFGENAKVTTGENPHAGKYDVPHNPKKKQAPPPPQPALQADAVMQKQQANARARRRARERAMRARRNRSK